MSLSPLSTGRALPETSSARSQGLFADVLLPVKVGVSSQTVLSAPCGGTRRFPGFGQRLVGNCASRGHLAMPSDVCGRRNGGVGAGVPCQRLRGPRTPPHGDPAPGVRGARLRKLSWGEGFCLSVYPSTYHVSYLPIYLFSIITVGNDSDFTPQGTQRNV